jgi:hypothetical protein
MGTHYLAMVFLSTLSILQLSDLLAKQLAAVHDEGPTLKQGAEGQ